MFDRAALRENRDGCLATLHAEYSGSVSELSAHTGVPERTLATWCRSHGLSRDALPAIPRESGGYSGRFHPARREDHGSLRAEAAEISPTPQREPWGLGAPLTHQMPPPRNGTDYHGVGIFDLHGKHREEGLWQADLRLIRATQPDFVILGGDGRTFDILSRWQVEKRKRLTRLELERETDAENEAYIRDIYEPLVEAANGAQIIELEGNHDQRWRDTMTDDPQEGWLAQREYFRVDDYLDGYYNRAGVFVCGHLMSHGERLGQYPAAAEYRHTHCSGWSGHGHAAAVHLEPPYPIVRQRFTHTRAPTSCRLDSDYGPGNAGLRRWHQGTLFGTFSATDPHDHATDVGLWNGRDLLLRGVRY